MNTLKFNFVIESLTCYQKGDGIGSAEPYLWTIFFKIDQEQVTLTNSFQLTGKTQFKFSEGSHKNITKKKITDGDVIKIPTEIGQFHGKFIPFDVPFFESKIPGLLGVVCILLEEDNVSDKGAENGHQALNKFVQKTINDSLEKFDPKKVDIKNIDASVKTYFDLKVSKFTEGIECMITGEIIKKQNLVDNLWSLADKDDLIGYKIWDYNHSDLILNNGKIHFSQTFETSSDGKWAIKGHLTTEEINQ